MGDCINKHTMRGGAMYRLCVYRTMRGWSGFVEGHGRNRVLCHYLPERGSFVSAARDAHVMLKEITR